MLWGLTGCILLICLCVLQASWMKFNIFRLVVSVRLSFVAGNLNKAFSGFSNFSVILPSWPFFHRVIFSSWPTMCQLVLSTEAEVISAVFPRSHIRQTENDKWHRTLYSSFFYFHSLPVIPSFLSTLLYNSSFHTIFSSHIFSSLMTYTGIIL